MNRLNETGGPTLFIGDGLSDRYAAMCADGVFAKDTLAAYCDEHMIPYVGYDNLVTLAGRLEDVLRTHARRPQSSGGRVFRAV